MVHQGHTGPVQFVDSREHPEAMGKLGKFPSCLMCSRDLSFMSLVFCLHNVGNVLNANNETSEVRFVKLQTVLRVLAQRKSRL